MFMLNLFPDWNGELGDGAVESIVFVLIGILGLFFLVKIFSWPLKVLLKLLANALFGVVLLILVNLVGSFFNIRLGINAVTAIIAGFFGVPGVVFLILFKTFM